MTNFDVSLLTEAGEVVVVKVHSVDGDCAIRDAFNAARRDELKVVGWVRRVVREQDPCRSR